MHDGKLHRLYSDLTCHPALWFGHPSSSYNVILEVVEIRKLLSRRFVNVQYSISLISIFGRHCSGWTLGVIIPAQLLTNPRSCSVIGHLFHEAGISRLTFRQGLTTKGMVTDPSRFLSMGYLTTRPVA